MNRAKLRQQLIHHEGLRLKPYRDSRGILTIGVGHNMEAYPVEKILNRTVGPQGITEAEAMKILDFDIDRVIRDVENNIFAYKRESEPRQHVLLDMAFNLGINGLLRFQYMLAALERRDYKRAADEMINSTWAGQVKGRAIRLANMMRNNTSFENSSDKVYSGGAAAPPTGGYADRGQAGGSGGYADRGQSGGSGGSGGGYPDRGQSGGSGGGRGGSGGSGDDSTGRP